MSLQGRATRWAAGPAPRSARRLPGLGRRQLCAWALATGLASRAWAQTTVAAAEPGAGSGAASAASPAAAPADRWFTSADGVALHYLEAGVARPQRPTLVLIPGWSMPAWIWAAQISHFAAHHRVLAFDPRGQGQSAIAAGGYTYRQRAHDIALLLQAAEVDDAVLVGWSLGVLECLQALSAGAQPPLRDRVRGLVLVDNSVGEGPPPVPARPTPGRPSFFTRLRTHRRDTVDAFVRNMFKQPQAAPWLAELTEAAMRLPVEASIALLNQNTPREFWRDTLYSLEIPVLYINTPRLALQGRLAQARRPSIESLVFDDAGHALFVDQAERFNTVLAGFLARLPAQAGGR